LDTVPASGLEHARERLATAYRDLVRQLSSWEHTRVVRAEKELSALRDRLQRDTRWQEVAELTARLSDRAAKDLDLSLEALGLVRRARHEQEIARLEALVRTARKRAKGAEKVVRLARAGSETNAE
jgi:hypothetical protein